MVIAFIGGIILGFLFFYSLDFGVKESQKFKNPSLVIFLISLARVAILLGGFYFLAQSSGHRFFAALVGALVSRIYIVYFYKNRRK
ncbi:MAG: ATP synthase subunit I [Cetobacterium sp.]